MNTFYEKKLTVVPSLCGEDGRLSLAALFLLFQDAAAEHAEKIGIGGDAMLARGLFWLTVRTRVRMMEKPRLMEELRLQTWLCPFRAADVRTDRCYRLFCGERIAAEGRTEWAVLRLKDQSVGRLGETGAEEDQPFPAERTCEAPYRRMRPDFSPEEQIGAHCVLASDIDMGRHMNNAAYVRALLDSFSARELAALPAGELEICFRAPCYDGEVLPLFRREREDGFDFCFTRPDGRPAALAVYRRL